MAEPLEKERAKSRQGRRGTGGAGRPSTPRSPHRLPPTPQFEKGTEPESEATEAEPDVIAENAARAALEDDYHYEDAFYDDED